jgi:YidC/Oxa1 family membrane protein insertase
MYDKKTWIVVTLCSIGLALNYYYSPKNPPSSDGQNAYNQAAVAEVKNEPSNVENIPPVATSKEAVKESLITIENDQVAFILTNIGGGVKYAELKKEYEIGDSKTPIRINADGKHPVGALNRGTLADALPYFYKADQSELGKSAVFIALSEEKHIIKKTYKIAADLEKPGAPYLLTCEVIVECGSDSPLQLSQWSVNLGSMGPIHKGESPDQTTFFKHDESGYKYTKATEFAKGWISDAKSKIDLLLEKGTLAGVCNQFFTIALSTVTPFDTKLSAMPYEKTFAGLDKPLTGTTAVIQLPESQLVKGARQEYQFEIFMGPKNNHMLRAMDEKWGDLMNYGFFSPVSRTLNWVLHLIHDGISLIATKWSWGISIILLTLCVRTVIWPLYNKSNRSMKRMAKLKPEMDKIRQKYADDPTRVNQETMKLYKKYGVNPIGGCLPMLLQIPIFFGFFTMLQYSVELRHQPFLWVQDLSQPDTFFIAGLPINVLPIVMTISSFLQMAMMPKTGDKMQQRIFMLMPFMFLFVCYFTASALALYWTVQNIFTIFQTWITSKLPEPQLVEKTIDPAKPRKKSFMEKLIEKQEELQRAQAAQQGKNLRNVTPKKPDRK